MKIKQIILDTLFFLITIQCIAQNQIPFEWKLRLKDDSHNKKQKNINILLSWERQGLSYLDSTSVLSTEFYLNSDVHKNMILEISLRLTIQKIFINDYYIGGDIKNEFIWAYNPNYPVNKYSIPDSILNYSKKNRITIHCSDFSYTGGKSHNMVKLYSKKDTIESKIDLLFDSKEHLFYKNDDIYFKVNTIAYSNGTLNIMVRNDYSDTLYIKNIDIKKDIHSYTVDLFDEKLTPGFYEVIATLKDKGYTGKVAWFTVSPLEIEQSSIEPKGFQEFWKDALNELDKIEPNYRIHRIDSLCTANRDGYIIEMQSIDNITIRGYYFIPKQKREYPAILHLPGYGYGFEYLDEFLNRKDDIIELALCVRGHGISKDDRLQEEYVYPGFAGYKICDKKQTMYRKIYMDCIRGIDFLLSRDEVNKSKVGVFGDSQGGGLAIMTAGLASEHVSALSYYDPFPCDLKNLFKIRPIFIKEINGFINYYNNACILEDAIKTLDYLDTKYFAKHINCPVFYQTGLFDDDCPPRLGFLAFKEVASSKRYKIYPYDSHIGESNYKKEAMLFFKEQFKF